MAATASLSGRAQILEFSAAVTPPTVTSSQQLTNLSPGDDRVSANDALPTQFVAFSAIHSDASGTATVVVFLTDDNSVGSLGLGKFRQVTLTIAATTTRTSHNTAAGGYVCTVTSSEPPLSNTVDVFGHGGSTWPKVYAGCTALSGGTLTLIAAPGRSI